MSGIAKGIEIIENKSGETLISNNLESGFSQTKQTIGANLEGENPFTKLEEEPLDINKLNASSETIDLIKENPSKFKQFINYLIDGIKNNKSYKSIVVRLANSFQISYNEAEDLLDSILIALPVGASTGAVAIGAGIGIGHAIHNKYKGPAQLQEGNIQHIPNVMKSYLP